MQGYLTRAISCLLCLATMARGQTHAEVTRQSFDPISGGSVTLRIDRDFDLCCSEWDWVGIYQNGARLSYVHSEEDEYPCFYADFSIPSTGGTFTFAYRTPLDGWQEHDLDLELTFADPAATTTTTTIMPLPAGVMAAVSRQAWDASTGGNVTLTVSRGPDVCCSAWDWVGIYQNSSRLSYVHSEDDKNPSFSATFPIPVRGGTFTFAYTTSLDGWKMHDLKIKLIPTGVAALVAQQAWDAVDGGSVTLNLLRGAVLCCSAWDWVGIYQNGARLSYVNSEDDRNPNFSATFSIPSTGGTFTFAYTTSLDGWKIHDLDLELIFADPTASTTTTTPGLAPALPMATIIPSYWWPTAASWDDLYAAVEASGLPADKVTVILNVNSGNITYAGVPSVASWALWQNRAANLSHEGFKTLAYVNLCSDVVDFSCAGGQGDKAFSGDHGVQAEIDKYVAEFGEAFAGIFFDDASHGGEHTEAILEATSYASSLGLETVHNPGVMSEDPVLFAAANATVLREESNPGAANPFAAGLPAEKSAMILHSVTGSAWRDYLDQARDRGFKYFYACEAWSSCPLYIEQQLAAIASTQEQIASSSSS